MVADLSWKATLTALLSRRHTAFRFSHPACLFQISTSGRIRNCFRHWQPTRNQRMTHRVLTNRDGAVFEIRF
jgi:hypothetical protein